MTILMSKKRCFLSILLLSMSLIQADSCCVFWLSFTSMYTVTMEQLPHRNCITSTCFPFTSLPIASSVLLFLFALPFKWAIAGSPRTMLCDRYRLLGRYVITPRCCRMSTFDSLIKHPPASFCRGEGGASACLKASQSRQSSLFVCLRLLVHISMCVSRQRWTDSAIMVVRTCLIPRVMTGKTDMPIL